MRTDQRADNAIRNLAFERSFTAHPHGSVLVRWGDTLILCTAYLEEGVPQFLTGRGRGWLTAEYAMLPGSTRGRKARDISRLRLDGRSAEIQRLIGRSLRAALDPARMPGYTLWIDCDVLQADGGTRCAAISGAWVAMKDAVAAAVRAGELAADPIVRQIAAVSVGVVDGRPLLDLDGTEDQSADVDMNLVMTSSDEFIEVQGSAEKAPFPSATMNELMQLGRAGIAQVTARQLDCLAVS